MGALGNYFEEEGIPTVGISLIRLHTEITTPPRALWVPFELGRPMGPPNNAQFQSKVLLSALKLLEVSSGPVIEDFNEDSPVAGDDIATIACPVSFPADTPGLSETDKILTALKQEVAGLRPWYEIAVQNRKRTTVGVSGLDLDRIIDFIGDFLAGKIPDNPRTDIELGYTLNLAIDDLKAYYSEAVTAQPGQRSPSSEALNTWFWKETIAGNTLFALKDSLLNSGDSFLKLVGLVFLVPVEFNK